MGSFAGYVIITGCQSYPFRTWNALLQVLLAFKVSIVKLSVILRIFHLYMICVFSLGDFNTFLFVLSTQYFTYDLLWGFSNVNSFVSKGFLHVTNSQSVMEVCMFTQTHAN